MAEHGSDPGPRHAEVAGDDRRREPAAAAGAGLDETVVSITLGADGRVYCHGITPALLPVLTALCPGDRQLAVRRVAWPAAGTAESGDAR